ncbi:hypothetical protein CK501_12570 [Halovibrio salipaludis]|uniref:DUF3450 domain-containing protein n=1 Tax=Halovibrio salipaludis TaxID=2032626 RepID=A0A2A2F4W2_9GAMM|nr:DUF3450 domain-containing protein [Halovibrio salipaludis]PAU79635.1 hypothetical protein CK501_12570 [Halovibrio salipaludis]
MTQASVRRPWWPVRSLLAVSVMGMVLGTTAQAQDEELEQIVETGKDRLVQNREMQQRINELDSEIREKVENYRSVNREIDGLEIYLAQLERQVESQETEMADLEQSIDEVTETERQITPLMLKMVDGLEQFVELDVPFLKEEREETVAGIVDTMDRSDVSTAEKFRNLLEAYQEEIEYGRTIEAYRGTLETEGNERQVDFLRIGRIALLYQTLDGSRSGVWDNNEEQWQTLPATYNSQVQEGLKIAREQAAPDLIRLPLSAPEEAEE